MSKPHMLVEALLLVMILPQVASATEREDTLVCFEVGTTYEPLDMKGHPVGKQLRTPTDCQKLCQQTRECYHFSYDTDAHLCHLQDMFATQMITRYGFIAGPKTCWEDMTAIQQKTMARLETRGAGMHTYVEMPFRCMEMSSMYVPVMRDPVRLMGPLNRTMRHKDALLACQHLCDETVGCYHFTMLFPEHVCSMSGAAAVLHHPVFGHAAGPPSCDHGPTVAPVKATTRPLATTAPPGTPPVATAARSGGISILKKSTTPVARSAPTLGITGVASENSIAVDDRCPDCMIENCQHFGHMPDGDPQPNICMETCSAQVHCSEGMICCPTGCGHTCMRLPESGFPAWVKWVFGAFFGGLICLSIIGCICGKGPKNKDAKKKKKKINDRNRGVEVEHGSKKAMSPEQRPLVSNTVGGGVELGRDVNSSPIVTPMVTPFNTPTLQSRPIRQESTGSAVPDGMQMVMMPVTTVVPVSHQMIQGNQQGHPQMMLVPPPPPGSMMIPSGGNVVAF